MTDRKMLRERIEKHLCHHDRRGAHRAVAALPALTISRQCGAGLGRLEGPLLHYLDHYVESPSQRPWALFDQSFLGSLIEENRLPWEHAPFLIENAKFPVQASLGKKLNAPGSAWTFFNHSATAIRKLCAGGHAIIVGRAGNFVTADLPNTFHVRLVGGKEKRIRQIAQKHGMSVPDATELVEETDKSRSRLVSRSAAGEIDDPGSYHLVINTDNLSDRAIVRLIGEALIDSAEELPELTTFPALVSLAGATVEASSLRFSP